MMHGQEDIFNCCTGTKKPFSSQSVSNSKCRRTEPKLNTAAGQWQLIIKIAGVRRRKAKSSAWAYEAKNLQGVIMFCGVASSAAISTYGAVLVEAAIKARSHGYHRILFLSNSRNLVQVINKKKNPGWQEKTMVADLKILYQMD